MNLKNNKPELYFHTIKNLKCSQIYYRIRKFAKMECGIGCKANGDPGSVHKIKPVEALDLDPVFLARFNASEWLDDRISFLHSSFKMNWNSNWNVEDQTPLWNFNLHYFEYLFPLLSEYRTSGEGSYFRKATSIIDSWIRQNPKAKGGIGWSPYTTDLRLTNWLSFYSMTEEELSDDFKQRMRRSIHEQYEHLSRHVEKDILGNHYFEDLKTLTLCAVFFQDRKMLDTAYRELLRECQEEILDDGMHFELSPMYHKLVLEGLIKVYTALEEYQYPAEELKEYITSMLDAAWSLEESLERIPLFNDCGDNVAKSLKALVVSSKEQIGIEPKYKSRFPAAGYYIFKHKDWKLIVDAGQPGPTYIPGHAHCDALSFELFKNGKPKIVNCGTYAYQSAVRNQFRSTAFHNTVMINGMEQSQCWGAFRMAKRSFVHVISADEHQIIAEMTDQAGQSVRRTIEFGDRLIIRDETSDGVLSAYLHLPEDLPIQYTCSEKNRMKQMYAPEYGSCTEIDVMEYIGKTQISVSIELEPNQGS